MLLLMGIRYRGAGDVDELGYVYVNEILDVRVNVQGWYTRCTCERTYVILNVQNVRNRLHGMQNHNRFNCTNFMN